MMSRRTLNLESVLPVKHRPSLGRVQLQQRDLPTLNQVLLAPKKSLSRQATVNMVNTHLLRVATPNTRATGLRQPGPQHRQTTTGWHGSTLEHSKLARLRKPSLHNKQAAARLQLRPLKVLMRTSARPLPKLLVL